MRRAYYLIDSQRSGIDNMAWDQAMLEQTEQDGIVRIRFYQWARPTVSLGYFQRYAEFNQFCHTHSSEDISKINVVRRATGGGAIVHHFDWTYAISIPAQLEHEKKTVGASCGLYFNLHRAIADWLNRHWLDSPPGHIKQLARLWGGQDDLTYSKGGCGVQDLESRYSKNLDFLCFNRRSSGDIVIGACKVMGSAQRRWKSALLQHGSLLLASSPFAPELLGLQEITGKRSELEGFCNEIESDLAMSVLDRMEECYQLALFRWDSSRPFIEITDKMRKRLESQSWIARI